MAILFALGLLMFIGSIILIWYICIINKFKRLEIKIDESFSGIDIALVKRHEVLTKMIEVVKGYAKHEKETLFKVIELRKDMSFDEKKKVGKEIDERIEKLSLVAENYPDLKASENFKVLQEAIADTEEHLQAARRLYNSNVTLYNQAISFFPSNVIARDKGLTKKEYFKASEEEKEIKLNI